MLLTSCYKTAKLLIAFKADASTHWVQSELDEVCHSVCLLAYMIHWMLHELLYTTDLHHVKIGTMQAKWPHRTSIHIK